MLFSRIGSKRLIAAALGLGTLISITSLSSADNPSVPDERKQEAWWADLEKGELEATRALLSLADRPNETVPFLKSKLKPLTISSGQVKALLLKLGSPNAALSKPAFEELEYFDPRLAIDLETLIDRYKENSIRHRLFEVLSDRRFDSLKDFEDLQLSNAGEGFNFRGRLPTGGGLVSWWAEHRVERVGTGSTGEPKKKWTRAVRAIVLLEHIRTPGAIAVLKELATGHPDAYPTKVAMEAVAAFEGKPMPPKAK